MTRRGGGGNDDESSGGGGGGGGGGGNPAARRGRDRRASAIACAAACCAAAAAAPLASSSPAVVAVSARGVGGAVFPPKSGKAAKSSKSSEKVVFGPYDDGGGNAPPAGVFVVVAASGDDAEEERSSSSSSSSFSSSSSSQQFARSRSAGCIDIGRYRSIHDDVIAIASRIRDPAELSHFYGGIVRLVAHDFMDHDVNDTSDPMGSDGCLDWQSLSNAGLSSVWHEGSDLFLLWAARYSDVSWADFWIIAANGVIFETSVGNAKLDLADTFLWGRDDRESCPGSAGRLPSTEGCRQVEGVFLERMGLTWRDAVALLGAHTLGRGHATVCCCCFFAR